MLNVLMRNIPDLLIAEASSVIHSRQICKQQYNCNHMQKNKLSLMIHTNLFNKNRNSTKKFFKKRKLDGICIYLIAFDLVDLNWNLCAIAYWVINSLQRSLISVYLIYFNVFMRQIYYDSSPVSRT